MPLPAAPVAAGLFFPQGLPMKLTLDELAAFVAVTDSGSITAAAEQLGQTSSGISRALSRLETKLGITLLRRTTRRLELTEEGELFLTHARQIVESVEQAEEQIALRRETPAGRLRVNAAAPFMEHVIVPLVGGFRRRYPQITLELNTDNLIIDLLEKRTDVAIRTGALKSSSLLARKLGETRRVIVGAPSYFARHGTPKSPADLERHNRLGLGFVRAVDVWPLVRGGRHLELPVAGNAQVSDGEALRQLTLNGLGLARLARFEVAADIAAGRLVPVLESCNPGDTDPVHAVFLGHGGHLPARVRAFLDYLVETVRLPV